MAKPMLVTLPFVLLLLDFWPLKREELNLTDNGSQAALSMWPKINPQGILRLILEKVPLMIMALAASRVTFYAQSVGGTVNSLERVSFASRIQNVIISYVAYLWKMVWPLNLAVFYPYPKQFSILTVVMCLLLLIAITVIVVMSARKLPYLLTGWFWYLGTLVPVIGIVLVGSQSMADRYTYIPLIGIFVMVAWGIPELLDKWQFKKIALVTLTGIVIPILIVFSWIQVGYWKNSNTLFRHALKVTSNNFIAHNNLAVDLMDRGDFDGALKHCVEALRISPNFAAAHVNLANALLNKGDIDGAIQQSRLAINLNPKDALAYDHLGRALFDDKRYDESLTQFLKCLKLNPGYGEAYKFSGDIMLSKENYNEAIVNYKETLRINSFQPEVYYHLGIAYFHKNNYSKAIECFQRAIEEDPLYDSVYTDTNHYLNTAKSAQLSLDNLIGSIKASIKADPQNPTLHMKLGNIYLQECAYDSANAEYQEVLSLQPQFIPAMYGLATIYSEKNEGSSAINILQKIKKIQPNNPDVYYNIACIYAKQHMEKESIYWLTISIDKGFHNWDQLKKDPDLANIRNTSYVIGLMKNHSG
jgi:tetratricopeptide (TPR) repeat protein